MIDGTPRTAAGRALLDESSGSECDEHGWQYTVDDDLPGAILAIEDEARATLEAEVAALREALEEGSRLAYGVPGAFPDGDDHVPDDQVSVSLRRNREAARAIVAALSDLPAAATEHDARVGRAAVEAAARGARLVRVAPELIDRFGARTERGERITAEWDEPDEYGVYEMVFTVHFDDSLGADLDNAYTERNAVVAALIRTHGDWPAWMIPAPDAVGWWIVYAETPQGQVSWHIGPGDRDLFEGWLGTVPPGGWDGHTTEEKYRRLAALLDAGDAARQERIETGRLMVDGRGYDE